MTTKATLQSHTYLVNTNDLTSFDNGKNLMARGLDQNISKTAVLFIGSMCTMVCTYQELNKDNRYASNRLMDMQGTMMHWNSKG